MPLFTTAVVLKEKGERERREEGRERVREKERRREELQEGGEHSTIQVLHKDV